MSNHNLPACCQISQDGAGGFEVRHTETSEHCHHRPSGGSADHPDGVSRCNRVIAHGRTRSEAVAEARNYFASI